MSEADAEWFTPEDRVRPPFVTPVTRRPARPTTRRPRPPPDVPVTRRPFPGTRRPRFPGARRRPTPLPGYPDNTAAKPHESSLSQAAIISITVVSCLLIVAIVLLLVYFLVIRRKIFKGTTKAQSKTENLKREDYSIRIEDVAHREIDDSDELYVNTKDLHRLATSLRSKSAKSPPPLPVGFSSSAVESNTKNKEPFNISQGIAEIQKPQVPIATVIPIPNTQPVTTISRKAPPPPKVLRSESQEHLIESTPLQSNTPSLHRSISKPNSRNSSPPKSIQKPSEPPPPAPMSSQKCPPLSQHKPDLPPLNVKLKPSLLKKPNQPKTPDTGVSYVPEDSENDSPSSQMSIKARRALIESALAKK